MCRFLLLILLCANLLICPLRCSIADGGEATTGETAASCRCCCHVPDRSNDDRSQDSSQQSPKQDCTCAGCICEGATRPESAELPTAEVCLLTAVLSSEKIQLPSAAQRTESSETAADRPPRDRLSLQQRWLI